MKLTYNQVHEAAQMESEGVEVWALAKLFNVHDRKMRKYLRVYYKYGKSFWSRYPTELEHGGHEHSDDDEPPSEIVRYP